MLRRQFLTLATSATLCPSALPMQSILPAVPETFHLPKDGRLRTGGCQLIEVGNGHRVWTKKVGDSPIKVLLLHGGPGGNYAYFECFEDFLPPNGVEFYYYDQLDSLNSDAPNDARLWTIERFRDEIEAVRRGLGLDEFYLYGQSWGGILAIEYALAYPDHLKGLVISNMVASTADFQKNLTKLRSTLPAQTLSVMNECESQNRYDSPAYQQAMDLAYHRYVCRLDPWPEPVQRTFKNLNEKIYNYFQGNNEFVVTGKLKGWDRWADMHRIRTRTLVMGARYDEMDPEDIVRMAELLPNGDAWISDKGSHLSMWDDQVPYFERLLQFLKSPDTT